MLEPPLQSWSYRPNQLVSFAILPFRKTASTSIVVALLAIYTHGNKLRNTCNNVTTTFGLNVSFFVKDMKNVLTICQNL